MADHCDALIARARCDYCGRYGPLGACAGCGAPNRPRRDRIEITTFADNRSRFLPNADAGKENDKWKRDEAAVTC